MSEERAARSCSYSCNDVCCQSALDQVIDDDKQSTRKCINSQKVCVAHLTPVWLPASSTLLTASHSTRHGRRTSRTATTIGTGRRAYARTKIITSNSPRESKTPPTPRGASPGEDTTNAYAGHPQASSRALGEQWPCGCKARLAPDV